jgi:bacterioferritin-associated ferredoxin
LTAGFNHDKYAAMIICSCNVISVDGVRACLNPGPDCPRTPADIHRCLGLRPQCGSCFPTMRALLDQAQKQTCSPEM